MYGTEQSIAELAEHLAERAGALAKSFDARNGTLAQSARVAALLAAEPPAERLPLSLTARVGAAVRRTPAAAAPPVVAGLPDVPADAGLDLLLDLIEEALRCDDEPRSEALWQLIEPFTGAAGLTALQQGRLADLRGMRLHGETAEQTEHAWTEALERYTAAGDEVRCQRIRGRLGLHRSRHGQPEEGLAQVRASSDYLLAHGGPKDQAGALRRLAVALLHAQQPGEALRELDRIAGVGEPDPGARVRLQVMLLRAQALGADGRVQESVAAARDLIEQAVAEDQDELIGLGEFFLGQGLSMLDDNAGAAAAFDRALARALPEPLEREVRERRAVLLAGTPRAREAVDDLVAMVARIAGEPEAGRSRATTPSTPASTCPWRCSTPAGWRRPPRSPRRRCTARTGPATRTSPTRYATCWPRSTSGWGDRPGAVLPRSARGEPGRVRQRRGAGAGPGTGR
ncbi:hypothetical protein ACFQZ4_24955 [Catellatospora coxensis]